HDLAAQRSVGAAGIHQPVSSHPQLIVTLGQIWNEEPALIVGYDNFAERDVERFGFCNHPYARLGSATAVVNDGTADAVRAHLNPKISGVPLPGGRPLK